MIRDIVKKAPSFGFRGGNVYVIELDEDYTGEKTLCVLEQHDRDLEFFTITGTNASFKILTNNEGIEVLCDDEGIEFIYDSVFNVVNIRRTLGKGY